MATRGIHATDAEPLLSPIRMIVTGDKALLFEPQASDTRSFLSVVQQHMQARHQGSGPAPSAELPDQQLLEVKATHNDYMKAYYSKKTDDQPMTPLPFELEVVESALMVATGEG